LLTILELHCIGKFLNSVEVGPDYADTMQWNEGHAVVVLFKAGYKKAAGRRQNVSKALDSGDARFPLFKKWFVFFAVQPEERRANLLVSDPLTTTTCVFSGRTPRAENICQIP
jgi:hypothetical protein